MEKTAPVFGQIRHSEPAQQRGHIHVVADALYVDPHRDTARDGHHRPAAGVRKAEFNIAGGCQTGLPMRPKREPNLRGGQACIVRQDGSQRGSRTNPAAAIGLKAKARGTQFFVGREHARGIAQILRRRCGVEPVVAVSEDAASSRHIAEFAHGTAPWIVAVRMVSEGVDIPRLRVGVFATTTTTELFFRQAVGRLVRWTRGLGPQPAYMFIPDDPRLRRHAVAIAEQRRHSLRRVDENGDPILPAEANDDVRVTHASEEQMSLFAPLAARALADVPMTDAGLDGMTAMPEPDDDDSLVLELAPAPRAGGGGESVDAMPQPSPRAHRRILRDANAAAVAELVRVVDMTHAQINAELNRRVGIDRIGEATIDELERRRGLALGWLTRSGRPR